MLNLLLIGIALTLGLFWLRSRERLLLIAFQVVAGLLVLLAIYQLVRSETVAEQMQRKTETMAKAVKAHDLDLLFRHVSDRFQMGRYDKPGLRQLADRVLASGDLTDVSVWSFDNAQVHDQIASIDFKVKARGHQGDRYFRCTATFIQDADGEWWLQSFKLFDGLNNQEVPLGSPLLDFRVRKNALTRVVYMTLERSTSRQLAEGHFEQSG